MMKILKIIPLFLIAGLTTACQNTQKEETQTVNLLCPTGAPAITLYNFKDVEGYEIETNANPSNIVAAMNNESTNAVILPTNAGIQAIQSGADYKIAATITFGNFYLCGTGNDEDSIMNEGDKVVLFQQNGIPDKLFKDIYDSLYSSLDIVYVTAASDAAGVLKTGTYISESGSEDVDYVLVADPSMRMALKNNASSSIYSSLRNKFKEKHNNMEITQASLFVKNTLNSTTIQRLMEKLEKDITDGLSNPSIIKQGMDRFGTSEEVSAFFGVASNLILLAQQADNGMGLGFYKSYDIKTSIDNFLSLIAPSIGQTDEEIYIK